VYPETGQQRNQLRGATVLPEAEAAIAVAKNSCRALCLQSTCRGPKNHLEHLNRHASETAVINAESNLRSTENDALFNERWLPY
jgi:hypothetical protein